MDDDLSKFTGPVKLDVGQGGTGGTTANHAGPARPASQLPAWDMVGQQYPKESYTALMSHLPRHENFEVGQREPSIHEAAPPVPPVPLSKCEDQVIAEIDLVHEFMTEDGYTLVEAQELAKVAVQPRSTDAWMALTAELDVLIDRYCTVIGTTDQEMAAIKAARFRQSLASIPATIAWFRAELAMLKVERPYLELQHPLEPEHFEGRDSAKAARMAPHRPIKNPGN